jgi:hypothetical protein
VQVPDTKLDSKIILQNSNFVYHDIKIQLSNIFFEKYALKCYEKAFKIVGSKYFGSDLKLDLGLFASQVGSGSKTERKRGSG